MVSNAFMFCRTLFAVSSFRPARADAKSPLHPPQPASAHVYLRFCLHRELGAETCRGSTGAGVADDGVIVIGGRCGGKGLGEC